MSALSIDLACCTKNLGVCLLTLRGNSWSPRFLSSSELHLTDPLEAHSLAGLISDFCSKEGIQILLIDGPQAWKDPDSDLPYCRACEKELATPAKTGTIGEVRPRPWTRFVSFSIDVFDFLLKCGAQLAESPRLTVPDHNFLALETFPTSAWRAIGLKPLPSKKKCEPSDISDRAAQIRQLYDLVLASKPTHDELQALVAGLAGLAVLSDDSSGYHVYGTAPLIKNGVRVEGYIVNPVRPNESGVRI